MNKKLLIIGSVLLVLMVLIGGVLFFLNNTTENSDEDAGILDENLVKMSPEDVGLTLESQQNNQQVVMELSRVDDIKSFEYELSYDAQESGATVSRGTFGSGPNPEEEGKGVISRVMDLGTCSSGKCKYDKGVTEVFLTLRVNLKNGEVGIIELTYSLN